MTATSFSPAMPRPRVLVVDDEAHTLELLMAWFTGSEFDVKAAADGAEALALARREAFDVVLTDLRLPGLSGLHLLSLLKQLDPAIEVIIMTGYATIEDAVEALRGGRAFDFLQKPIQNLQALNAVIRHAVDKRQANRPAPPPADEVLSPRERELMGLLAQGLDNRGIAERLCISAKTARNHLSHIYEKLGVKSRTQALIAAQQRGLV